jgi:predicted nucleic acid-binding protein
MAWVVDTNLLLDVALDDPLFQVASMELLRKRRRLGLVACPVTIVEIAPTFDADAVAIREFLDALNVTGREPWTERDTTAACGAWTRHVTQRRARLAGKRLVADVLIGAFAERFDGLLTRNAVDFRALFPNLKIESP